MNITKEQIDDLNAVVKVAIQKDDYQNNVTKILNDYRKTANIPGFRKGHVPMGMVKKQYGKAVLIDEVNKLIQESLNKYLVEEKLDILGNPLPKTQENLDWDADDFSFEFELGLTPSFEIKLKGKKAITHYKIIADDKMINEQIENLQKQYGKLLSKKAVETTDDEITGTFVNESEDINNRSTFELNKIKGKKNIDAFTGAKAGDAITLKTKNLFKDEHDLMKHLKIEHDKAHNLNIDISFTIDEVNQRVVAPLNQEFFDKLFGKDAVKSTEALKQRIKADAEVQFAQQSDQTLLSNITDYLIENTKFELPAAFLTKWIKLTGENPITEEEASEEYKKSEKGLRYQLIESKIIKDNNLQTTMEELRDFAGNFAKQQMARFGQTNPDEKTIAALVDNILKNEDEARRLSEQLMSQKLLNLYKNEANLKTKEVTFQNFVKEVYGK